MTASIPAWHVRLPARAAHRWHDAGKLQRASMSHHNIDGKVVVITGASSGLGEATARMLSREGATVVLGARRVDRITALADELGAAGGRALALQTDVTRSADVQRLVDAAVEKFG